MRLVNTAIIRLTLFLLAGIFTGFQFSPPLDLLYFLLAAGFLFFTISFLRSEKLLLQDSLFGLSSTLLFFLLGFVSVQLHQPGNQDLHFSNLLTTEEVSLVMNITETLKPSQYQNKYIAEVKQTDGMKSFGKILLLLPEGSRNFYVDDQLAVASSLEPIPISLNPQQFDYRSFMENRGILYQISPAEEEILLLKDQQETFAGVIEGIHSRISKQLKKHQFEQEELSIVQALLLGQRREIPTETYENFVDAGVVHILAVSGLHVGLILIILNFLLSPLDNLKKGKIMKIFLLLIFLWGYALLAGLSPSVVRAVSMFSFVAVGMQLRRQTSVLNTLFLSLMLLLLVRPQWMFEVGFQLSYLAVFSIVLLQPVLGSLYRPKNRLLKYFWSLFTVTLAAQIGVMPLSLFYFHQFPGLFFLSNMLILPFLGILMGFGILVICLALANILPSFLAEIFDNAIKLLNELVSWVARQEDFLFREIPFSLPTLFAFYSLLLLFLLSGRTLVPQRIKLVLGGLILLQATFIYDAASGNNRELVIFHKSQHTVIAEKQKRHLKVTHNLPTNLEQQVFLKNYSLIKKISSTETATLKNLYELEDGLLLVLDSSAVYRIPGLQPKRVLLTKSPKINLERLLTELQPDEIIADGSNYHSSIKRWRTTCRKQKIAFHYTGEEGAYIISESGSLNAEALRKWGSKKNPFSPAGEKGSNLFRN